MKRPEGMSFAEYKETRTALNKELKERIKKWGVVYAHPSAYYDTDKEKMVFPKKFPFVRGE